MSERLAVLARHLAAPAQSEQQAMAMAPTSSSLSPSQQQLAAFCPRELAKYMTHDNHELRGRIQEFLKVRFSWIWRRERCRERREEGEKNEWRPSSSSWSSSMGIISLAFATARDTLCSPSSALLSKHYHVRHIFDTNHAERRTQKEQLGHEKGEMARWSSTERRSCDVASGAELESEKKKTPFAALVFLQPLLTPSPAPNQTQTNQTTGPALRPQLRPRPLSGPEQGFNSREAPPLRAERAVLLRPRLRPRPEEVHGRARVAGSGRLFSVH